MANGHFASCDLRHCSCESKRYWLILTIGFAITTVEAIGAYLSGSLALWADAGHVLGDIAANTVALVVAYRVKNEPDAEEKIRTKGAYASIGVLALISVAVVIEGFRRYFEPPPISYLPMIIVSIIGCAGNFVQHSILDKVARKDQHETHRLLSIHILSDLFQSIGVILAGIFIFFTGKMWIDPIISIGIGIWIGYQVITRYREISGGTNSHCHGHMH